MGVRKRALEDLVMQPSPQFWAGKRVLLTGHTGFKGGWLALWLSRMGAQVTGVALVPNTRPNLFELARLGDCLNSVICDIRNADDLARVVNEAAPEIVLHLAAQPLVRASYVQPLQTFDTNVMGTANLLEAVRRQDGVEVVLIITTDKVYHNREWEFPYREGDPLGGHDPYSASKAASELVVASYRSAFLAARGVRVATARAGNVIGGGDWSPDRLIPDAVKAWEAGEQLLVRRPASTRPWQHVLEPLAGYMILAEALWGRKDLPEAFNFGPEPGQAATVRTVIDIARQIYVEADVRYGEEPTGPHEAGALALEISRTRSVLGVSPVWPLRESVERTMNWYRRLAGGADAAELCLADIDAFCAAP